AQRLMGRTGWPAHTVPCAVDSVVLLGRTKPCGQLVLWIRVLCHARCHGAHRGQALGPPLCRPVSRRGEAPRGTARQDPPPSTLPPPPDGYDRIGIYIAGAVLPVRRQSWLSYIAGKASR